MQFCILVKSLKVEKGTLWINFVLGRTVDVEGNTEGFPYKTDKFKKYHSHELEEL